MNKYIANFVLFLPSSSCLVRAQIIPGLGLQLKKKKYRVLFLNVALEKFKQRKYNDGD